MQQAQALQRPHGMTKSEWQREKAEFSLASSIVDILTFNYPGFAWTANVKTEQGVILLSECTLMDSTIPFIIRICEVDHSEKAYRKAIVKAGGEILERYFLPREAINKFQAAERKQLLPRDFRGNVLFDAHGVPNCIGKNAATIDKGLI